MIAISPEVQGIDKMLPEVEERSERRIKGHPSLTAAVARYFAQRETNGAKTYALPWGVNAGRLDRTVFEPAVLKGRAALNRAVLPDGKLGYVQRVGAAPGDTSADETEVYGVGAFLLAGSEVHQLARAR